MKNGIILRVIFSIFMTVISPSALIATTLVSDSFDDITRTYASGAMAIYYIDQYGIDENRYTKNHARGGSGYCLSFDDSIIDGRQVFVMGSMSNDLDEGIYFRYYVFWDSDYHFGSDDGLLDNKKMFKTAAPVDGQPDIEIIYRPYERGIVAYIPQDSDVERYFSGSGQKKGEWNKIEIYIKIDSGNNDLHVQVNDIDLCNYSPDITNAASEYTGTEQFISTRASNRPARGQGYWWVDDVTIVHDEGDLCDNEPPEPSGVVSYASDDGGGGGCFIATAAYGSSMEKEVMILKNFRDAVLLKNSVGEALVEFYYKVSPPAAGFIAKHDNLRMAVRWNLLTAVGICWTVLKIGLIQTAIIVILLISLAAVPLVLRITCEKTNLT